MNLEINKGKLIKLIKKYYSEVHNLNVRVSTHTSMGDRTYTPDTIIYIHYNIGIGDITAATEEILTDEKLIEIITFYLDDNLTVKSIYFDTTNSVVGDRFYEGTKLQFNGVNLQLEQKKEKVKKI